MTKCSCLKPDGKQCTRVASTKSGHNPLFCWQHQKCAGTIAGAPIVKATKIETAPIVKATKIYTGNYIQLIEEAITDLKEYEKGSSRAAIKKYIEEVHKIELVPSVYKAALAQGVADGKLVLEGNRYKLSKHL